MKTLDEISLEWYGKKYCELDDTKFTNYKTYGNLDTVRSHIGREDFNRLLTNHAIIKEENNVFGKSLLIEKI